MSSYSHFESSSSSSSSDEDNGLKQIYRGAAIATVIYEMQQQNRKTGCWGNSRKVRRYFRRDRIGAHECLKQDYFDQNCTYSDEMFRRRFRMNRLLFMRIHNAVVQHDPMNFQQRRDAAQKLGVYLLYKRSQLRLGCWRMEWLPINVMST